MRRKANSIMMRFSVTGQAVNLVVKDLLGQCSFREVEQEKAMPRQIEIFAR